MSKNNTKDSGYTQFGAQIMRTVVDGNASRLYDLFISRDWEQEEVVKIAVQAWRRDCSLGRQGRKMYDGGLTSAVYAGVLEQQSKSFGPRSNQRFDNASTVLMLAAIQEDSAELLALVWKWAPDFRLISQQEDEEDPIPTILREKGAMRCAIWYQLFTAQLPQHP
jgi:hypothetical protein